MYDKRHKKKVNDKKWGHNKNPNLALLINQFSAKVVVFIDTCQSRIEICANCRKIIPT